MAREKNMQKVEFELDSKITSDAVNKDSLNIDWRPSNSILEKKSLFRVFSSWHCNYVPKEKNKVADIYVNLQE